jgi:hypothetical protein
MFFDGGKYMNKQKIGLILFCFAVIWALAWGVVVSVICSNAMNTMTAEELSQSAWASTGPLMMVWGVLGVPLAAILAMIGIFLFSGAKGAKSVLAAFGVIVAVGAGMAAVFLGHIRLLFGIGGTLILLFFLGILWFWAKERKAGKGASTAAADLKLIGYVFMVIGAWFTCGGLSFPLLKAFEGQQSSSPINIMIYFVLGWFFLFLSHYKAGKEQS